MRLLRAFVAAALFCVASFHLARAKEIARLPAGEVPVSYALSVAPDTKTWTTSGEETVVIRLDSSADRIALNARDISITQASIDGEPARTDTRTKIQQVWFSLVHPLAPGTHTLHLRFQSLVFGFTPHSGEDIQNKGFFNAGGGPQQPMLVSMFERSTARLFFPCFDEPQFRAPITLHVTAPPDWTVVSNMPGTHRITGPAAQWDFSPTPAMPVYLLTLDMGRMASVAGSSDGIPIRVFASPKYAVTHAASLTRSLSYARTLLHYYDSSLGVRYPLPKLDLVIAPNGLYTALEQWGAITFYDPAVIDGAFGDDAPARNARAQFSVIAHEMAHLWFGDLVGMRWWNQVFVAEGLAEFAQEAADTAVGPAQQWWRDDDSNADGVMRAGVSRVSLPVVGFSLQSDDDDRDEVAFSLGAYYKSAAVVRMWEQYVGRAAFKRGMRRYLRLHAGTAVDASAFWASFDDARAAAFGRAWLARPGFPIVDVASSCAGGRRTLHLAQTPFTNGKATPPGYRAQIWPVPLFVRQSGRSYTYLLDRKSMRVTLGACTAPFTIDYGMRPYYRVRYAKGALQAFVRALPSDDARDRVNATRDALALFKAHAVPAGYLLDVAGAAPTSDALFFNTLGRTLSDLLTALPRGPERAAVATAVRRVAQPVALQQMHSEKPSSIAWPMTLALMEAGDARIAPQARAAMQWTLDHHVDWSDTAWAFASIAAEGADPQTVTAMERLVQFPVQWPKSVPIVPLYYLEGVSRPDLVASILAYYRGEPQIVFGLAARNPRQIWSYLQTHADEVRRHAPPSQQGWVLANGVASSLWDIVPPAQMRAFLERTLGPGYQTDIDAALRAAAARRAAGEGLAAQIDAWMPPARKSAVTH